LRPPWLDPEALQKGRNLKSLEYHLRVARLVPNIESNEPFIMDGWVSLEGSPLLAHDTASTIAPGLNSQVGSVASIFISRWEVAILSKVPEELNNRLGMAIAGRIDKAYVDPLSNPHLDRASRAPGGGQSPYFERQTNQPALLETYHGNAPASLGSGYENDSCVAGPCVDSNDAHLPGKRSESKPSPEQAPGH
jgi:hypothetical protein